jgi:hypothetical protein
VDVMAHGAWHLTDGTLIRHGAFEPALATHGGAA